MGRFEEQIQRLETAFQMFNYATSRTDVDNAVEVIQDCEKQIILILKGATDDDKRHYFGKFIHDGDSGSSNISNIISGQLNRTIERIKNQSANNNSGG